MAQPQVEPRCPCGAAQCSLTRLAPLPPPIERGINSTSFLVDTLMPTGVKLCAQGHTASHGGETGRRTRTPNLPDWHPKQTALGQKGPTPPGSSQHQPLSPPSVLDSDVVMATPFPCPLTSFPTTSSSFQSTFLLPASWALPSYITHLKIPPKLGPGTSFANCHPDHFLALLQPNPPAPNIKGLMAFRP